jgi:cell division GTPase FtsZ
MRAFGSFSGTPLHEGLTEYLARKISPDLQIRDLGESYPKERRLVEMLFARAGDDALQRAYFQGDWRLLQQRVERDLGEGALEKVIQAAKQENYEEAERLLKGF